MIDELWDNVLEAFAEEPAAAFIFAQTLFTLKQAILNESEGRASVIQALDRAIERLYPYTHSYKASYELYIFAGEGKLLPKHDPITIVDSLD